MAIAFDANGGTVSTASTLTWGHTVGAGADRVLFIGISGRSTGANNTVSVTYAGVACSRIHAFIAPATGLPWLELWQLTNPPVGTANVVATYGTAQAHSGVSLSYTGVIQSEWFDLVTEVSEDGSTTLNLSVDMPLPNRWLLIVAQNFSGGTLSFSGVTLSNSVGVLASADSAGTVATGSLGVTITTTLIDIAAIVLILEPSDAEARVMFPPITQDL